VSSPADRRAEKPLTRSHGKARFDLYDVAVVGGQLAGVVAGALLAKRGYRVLHVDHDGLGSGYVDRGHRLPYGPAIIPSLRSMPSADAILQELGLATDVYRQLTATELGLQVLLPRHRVDLHREPAKRAEELAREFGPGGAQIEASFGALAAFGERAEQFLRLGPALPPHGFVERFRLSRSTSPFPELRNGGVGLASGTEFASAMESLASFLTFLDSQNSGLGPGRPLSLAIKGGQVYPGGVDGLRETIRRRIDHAGGDVLGGEEGPALVEELLFDGSRADGVKLASPEAEHKARMIIAATDPAALRRMLPPKRRKRRVSETLDAVRTRSYLFTVNLVVRAEAIPPGLGDLGVIVPEEGPVGPILFQVLGARLVDDKADASGQRVIALGAFVPASTRDVADGELRKLADSIVEAAAMVLPFYERHEVLRSAPYLDARGTRGSRLLPHPRLEVDLPRHLGVTGLPQRLALKNLFIASREVLPGLGLEGEFIAGQRVADMVQELLRKYDPLK
jgi:hypothetical protein